MPRLSGTAWATILLALLLAACGGGTPLTSPPATPVVTRSEAAATTVPDASPTESKETTQADGPGVAVPDEGSEHLEEGAPVEYENSPPASGPHYTRTVEYGVYEQIVPAPYWVHNLEHGALVLLYRCPDQQESCPDVLRELQSLYERTPPGKYGQAKLVVTQYPDLETSYAVLAWNRVLELDESDEDQVLEFYRAWVDKGPEDVP